MQALCLHDGSLVYSDHEPIPLVQPDEALIRVELAGICNTDLELVGGFYDFDGILGHEFVGVVEAGPESWLGERVVGEINIGCGHCDFCLKGIPSHCRNRHALGIHYANGVFADYCVLPVANLIRVPATISNDQAVFTEPLAAAVEIVDQFHVKPTSRVVVIGAGKLGMLAAQVLRLTACDLSVVVRYKRQRDLLELWGIKAVSFSEIPAHSVDVVVDCTGQQTGFQDALEILRPRGTVVLKSTYEGLPQVNLSAIAANEYAVLGSRCGPFEPALRLLEQNLVDVVSLIDARYPLKDGIAALQKSAERGVMKVILENH